MCLGVGWPCPGRYPLSLGGGGKRRGGRGGKGKLVREGGDGLGGRERRGGEAGAGEVCPALGGALRSSGRRGGRGSVSAHGKSPLAQGEPDTYVSRGMLVCPRVGRRAAPDNSSHRMMAVFCRKVLGPGCPRQQPPRGTGEGSPGMLLRGSGRTRPGHPPRSHTLLPSTQVVGGCKPSASWVLDGGPLPCGLGLVGEGFQLACSRRGSDQMDPLIQWPLL